MSKFLGGVIMNITILHTNDIHSNFLNYGRIVTKIKQLRDENTIILDAGDFNDFKSVELQGTNGTAGAELLNIGEYDAISIGNNETNEGMETLKNIIHHSNMPFLTCNLKNMNLTSLEGTKSSIIIEKSHIKFLIIGTSPNSDFYFLNNLCTEDYKKAIAHEMTVNKGKYDICILLSHLGLIEDREIASVFNEIHIIIDGHSHKAMEKAEFINNTIIHMSGCYGEWLGKLNIEFEKLQGTYKIKNFTDSNIKIDNSIKINQEVLQCLSKNKAIAEENLSKPMYSINRDMWQDVIEENPITNLLADGLKDFLHSDLAIINSGVLNGGIRKGGVSKLKLLEICPSPLNPTIMYIKGSDIFKAFQISADADVCLSDGKGSGFRGKYLGRLHLSGGTVEYSGKNVTKITVGNEELQFEKWYKVASSDYLKRGSGYKTLGNNKDEKYFVEFLRDILEIYLNKPDFLEKAYENRWKEKSI